MDHHTRLSVTQRVCYGLGHVLNDICASMWFTYLLVFFHLVLKFDSTRAGALMLIGQVADALSTPFVGIYSDKNDRMWLCRYGKRKSWHLVGTLLVLLTFPFIFNGCIYCRNASLDAQMVYYGAFIAIFQFGWASVQISHLALIPDLTPNEHHRTRLTSLRSSFSVLSNILVYIATFLALRFGTDTDSTDQIGPQDEKNFEHVVYAGISIGLVTSILFHAGVKETKTSSAVEMVQTSSHKTTTEFLRDGHLYMVALVYVCSRLFANLGQVYIPLYLHETLVRSAESLAIVPLLMYLSSLAATFVVQLMNRDLGRVFSFAIGSFVGIGGCVWIQFGSGIYYNEYEIYLVAILLGFGASIMLVTTLGITADLIGHDTNSGAFVYGSMSFCDKLVNGIAVMVIQHWKCDACPNYYRNVLSGVCGAAAIIGLIPLFFLRHLSQRYIARTDEPLIDDASINSTSIVNEPLVH